MKRELIEPRKFQEEGVKLLENFDLRAILGDEPGLGKTLQALKCIENNPAIKRVLIVCQAHLKWFWKREAKRKFNMKSVVLEGRTPYDYAKRRLTIINYDIIWDWVKYLDEDQFDLLICDEGHLLSNTGTKRSRGVHKVSEMMRFVLVLSGTPVLNNPGDIWNILNLTRPDVWDNQFAFGLSYTHPSRENGRWVYRGALKENLHELNRILRETVLVRRTKREVMPDLPKKSRFIVPLDVDLREYRMAERDFRKWLRTYHPEKAKKNSALDARVRMGYMLRLIAKLKLPSIKLWIDDFFAESESKLAIFTINRIVTDPLAGYYKEACTLVDGRTIGDKRQSAFDQFNKDDECRLFIGQLLATNTGWSARQCNHCAFTQFGWRAVDHRQAEDRFHGIERGGGLPLFAYYLYAHGTIEADQCAILQRKANVADMILEGKKAQKEDEFNIFDSLISTLKEKWE